MSRYLYIIFLLLVVESVAQVPSPTGPIQQPQAPKFITIEPVVVHGGSPITRPSSPFVIPPSASQPRQQQSRDEVRALLDEDRFSPKPISYSLPSRKALPEAASFQQAFQEMSEMLTGKAALSTKRAVYLVESAYLGKAVPYSSFCTKIAAEVDWVRKIQSEARLGSGNTASRFALHRHFTDTLIISGKRHFPFRYDFDDPWGYQDYTKVFVSKLLSSRSGQCHSLPLFY